MQINYWIIPLIITVASLSWAVIYCTVTEQKGRGPVWVFWFYPTVIVSLVAWLVWAVL